MDWKNIFVLVLLIGAIGCSYVTFVLGYIKYRRVVKDGSVSQKFNKVFFTFLIISIVFYLLWGFSRNLTVPF